MNNAISVTTGLMAAFGLFVIYTRMKSWLESNIPILFYIALILYMKAIEGGVPLWLSLAGLACSLTLRFEFMNNFMVRTIKVIEIGILGVITYLCVMMVWE